MQKIRQTLLFILSVSLFLSLGVYLFWINYGSTFILQIEEATRSIRQDLKLHAPTLPWLSVEGKNIVDENGKVKILRGVNVASINWGTDVWNSKAVGYVVDNWEARVIRTRIFQDEFEQDPEAFFAKMEWQVIQPARSRGVYVILHPWIHDNEPLPDEGTIEMWRAIAEKYKDDPTILYDFLAEPREVSQEELRQAYVKLIETIRQIHPRSLIFVTGLGWGREINSWLEDPLPYENLVYRSNPYNKPGEFESLFGEIAQKYPVFLGEFGADAYPPMTRDSVKALLDYAEDLGIGWTAWNFSSQGCPCLLKEEKQFLPSDYGEIVKTVLLKNEQQEELTTSQQPLEEDPAGVYRIYSDRLHHSFLDYSWDADIDLVNSEKAFSGEKSLKIKYLQAESGFYVHSFLPINSRDFSYLSFWFYPIDKGTPELEIYFKDTDEELSLKLPLKDYLGEEVNGWQQIRVPLKSFDFINPEIKGFFIKNTTANSILEFYLDELQFEQ